jgi:hypothetical protein
VSERDLTTLLGALSVRIVPGAWCMVSGVELPAGIAARATILESEGVTSVISVEDAARLGITPVFAMAWLSLDVNSALDAVGLTAAITTALAENGMACNVLAGYHHDHLLVSFEDRGRAIGVLDKLAADSHSS